MYTSILFCKEPFSLEERNKDEIYFGSEMLEDLNLNQLIYSVSAGGKREHILKMLQTPLKDSEEVYFRQSIFRDLEDEALRDEVFTLVKALEYVDEKLLSLERLVYEEQREVFFLHIVNEYCSAINHFWSVLKDTSINSSGFKMVFECFEEYVSSDYYRKLNEENQQLISQYSEICYSITFQEDAIVIADGAKTSDFNSELLALLQQFLPEGKRKGYCRKVSGGINMNLIEYRIMQCVRKMNAQAFRVIQAFYHYYSDFREVFVRCFCEEVQFYASYLKYIAPLRAQQYPFTYTHFADNIEQTQIEAGYDLVLGIKSLGRNTEMVWNEFCCLKNERVFVVTGPNQGGKTTFSRMLGQIYYLSILGVPIPAQKASIVFPKGIFTHFEHEEVAYHDKGKLQDDLVRMRYILDNATDGCLILINEMLSSTSYKDAIQIGEKIIEKLQMSNNISIYVTFVDELSRINKEVVSMVSEVQSLEHGKRTYKIRRQNADGLAYAKALADKYNLSYEKIKSRLYQNMQGG